MYSHISILTFGTIMNSIQRLKSPIDDPLNFISFKISAEIETLVFFFSNVHMDENVIKKRATKLSIDSVEF